MSTTVGSESASSTTIPVEDQVNDASTTTVNEMEDVKNILNGTQASVATSEEESWTLLASLYSEGSHLAF